MVFRGNRKFGFPYEDVARSLMAEECMEFPDTSLVTWTRALMRDSGFKTKSKASYMSGFHSGGLQVAKRDPTMASMSPWA